MGKTKATKAVLSVLVLLLAVVMLLGACAKPAPAPAPTPAPAPAPAPKPAPVKIALKASTAIASKANSSKAFVKWLDLLNERTKGELTVEYLGGPEVIPGGELPLGVRDGTVHIALVTGSNLKGLVPEAQLLGMTRIPAEEEEKVGAVDFLRERCAEAGLYFIGRLAVQPEYHFWMVGNKKVTRPQEMKGLRYGATGTYAQAFVKALGMSFSMVKRGDSYGAMERGMFDMFSSGMGSLGRASFHEVSKYVINHPFYRSNASLIMDLDAWNKLPKHLQEVLDSTYKESWPDFINASLTDISKSKQAFKDAGAEWITFSDADAKWFIDLAFKTGSETYIKDLPETAPVFLKMVGALK